MNIYDQMSAGTLKGFYIFKDNIAVMIRSEKVVLSTMGRVDSVVKLEQCIIKTLNVNGKFPKYQP